jgi:ubiquinone/menaquinone biosynthesis C-methylase UbiE
MRRSGNLVLNASAYDLPFKDESFNCVVCSELIEHIPSGKQPFLEMRRVLRPGGKLIVGTPDYSRLSWRIIETAYGFLAPGGYADEHITHYSQDSLIDLLKSLGFVFEESSYILGSELIILCTKTKDHPT